ncbi:MAG: oligopeptide transporter, OPT family, partial [Planctomycetota bacterium]
GGLLRYLLTARASSPEEAEARRSSGTLLGSGLVGGEGLVGVGIAGIAVYRGTKPEGWAFLGETPGMVVSGLLFAALVGGFWTICRKSRS